VVPEIVSCAESLTETVPSAPIVKGFGMSLPAPVFGVVVRPDSHLPTPPRPSVDRFTPPSYSSPCRYVWFPLLSVYGHGAVVPLVAFTIPQKESCAPTCPQLAAFDVA